MLKWIPIPSKVRRFSGRNLLRFTAWREKRAVQSRINSSASPVIKRLRRIKKSLPPGRPLIGILLTEHFGDIIACEPVIPWLKSQYPAAYLVWLARPAYAAVLKHHPQLDAVEEIGSVLVCENIIRDGVFDHCVDLHIQRKFCTAFNREYVKQGSGSEINIQNYYSYGALLEVMSLGAGIPRLEAQPRMFTPTAARQAVDGLKLPANFAVIHARSNLSNRNWDDRNWNELAETLVNRFGLTVVEIGLDSVLGENSKGVINLCGKLSLAESSEVIRRAVHFFGVDSGPAHVANAFQVPSVVLLGHYDVYQSYMPYTGFLRNHADTMVIQWNGLASEIPVAEVLRRFEQVQMEHTAKA
jgi:heptosyltransferase-3